MALKSRLSSFADELVWGEAPEGFEPSGEVVGVDEVLQVGSQLVVGFVEVAFDSRVLDSAVHSFDLPVDPGMLGLCQPMIDVVLGAGVFEGMRPDGLPGVEGGLDVRAAELVLPGVVKWVPLSVRTVRTL